MAGHLELKRGIGANISEERDALYEEDGQSYVQFSTLDSAAISSGNAPIGRPTSGTAYSMEVWLYLKCTKAPDNQIDNIRFWGTGENPEGIHIYVGTSQSTAYTPTLNKSSFAINNATAYSDQSNSLVWSTADLTAINDLSYPLILQARVDSGAAQGDESGTNMVYHYSFDES